MRFHQIGGYLYLGVLIYPLLRQNKILFKLFDLLRLCKHDQKNIYLFFYNNIAVKCGGEGANGDPLTKYKLQPG